MRPMGYEQALEPRLELVAPTLGLRRKLAAGRIDFKNQADEAEVVGSLAGKHGFRFRLDSGRSHRYPRATSAGVSWFGSRGRSSRDNPPVASGARAPAIALTSRSLWPSKTLALGRQRGSRPCRSARHGSSSRG